MEEIVLRSPTLARDRRTLRGARESIDAELGVPAIDPAATLEASDAAAREDAAQALEAARLHEEAERRREALEQAYVDAGKKGYADGLAEGRADAAAASAERLRRLDALIESLASTRDEFLAAAEDDAVAIVFESLCDLLGEAFTTRAAVAAHVRAAIAWSNSHDPLSVRLHPVDLERLMSEPEDGFEPVGRSKLTWVADDTLAHGGCVVETTAGTLEARLERQLQDLRTALLTARTGRRAAREGA